MNQFKNQRHMRRSFFCEFKIHCFNYKLLLFESVIRILTTLNKEADEDGGEEGNNRGRRKAGDKSTE